jgi:hypothetical protein
MHVGAQSRKAAMSSLLRTAADNEPLLSRYDCLDIRDRDDE